jgi:hypothetical protein
MRIGIMLASAALLLGACGSGTDVGSEEAAEFQSPIGEFLGFDTAADFNSEDEQARYQEQEREAQQRMADCMRAEGFEYTPVDYSEINSFDGDAFIGPDWGSEEWIELYGFGISTQRFSQAQVGPDLIGYEGGPFGDGNEDFVDPNQDYVEGLSQEEQDAYYSVLYGSDTGPDLDFENLSQDEVDEAFDEYYQDYVPTGCQNTAYEDIFEQDDVFGEDSQFMEFQEEFGDELDELFNRVESDTRMVEARQKITTCVAEKGYSDYVDEQSVFEDIENRMSALETGNSFRDPFFDLSEDDTQAMSEEDFEAMIDEANNETMSEADKALLGEIQTYELGLAAAVKDCGGGFLGTNSELNEIMAEIEQEWLDANRDRISEYEGVASSDG